MTISYAVVVRGQIIIADFSPEGITLERDIQKILEQPFVNNEQRRINRFIYTFLKGSHGVNFICATSPNVDNKIPLTFLDVLSNRWNSTMANKGATAGFRTLSAECQPLFVSALNDSMTVSKSEIVQKELEQTQRVMTDTLNSAMIRGDQLSSLSAKSEDLLSTSDEFRRESNRLKNKMICAYAKSISLILFAVLVMIFMMVVVACGGFTFPKCKSNSDLPK